MDFISNWWVKLVILVFVMVVSLSGLLYPIHFDEGVFGTMGSAMQNGIVPYRDLWDHKGPGIYLVSSFVLQVSSNVVSFLRRQESMDGILSELIGYFRSYLVNQTWIPASAGMTINKIWFPRLIVLGVNWASAGLVFLIAREIWEKREIGVIGGISYLVLLQVYQGQYWLTESWMNVFVLGALFLVAKGDRGNKGDMGRILLIGVCLGMGIMFNQKAVVNVLVIGHWSLVICKMGWKKIMEIGLGAVIVWLPVVGYFWYRNAWGDMWQAVVVFNLWEYRPMWWETVRELPRIMGVGIVVWGGTVYSIGKFLVSFLSSSRTRGSMVGISEAGGFKSKNWVVISTMDSRLRGNDRTIKSGKILLWLMALVPLPVVLMRPYHHYWLQILPFAILIVVGELWHDRWWRWVWVGYVGLVGAVGIWYGVMVGFPEQRLQIEKAVRIEGCGDFREEPWMYYLKNCKPKQKVFYVI